jgi:hypothetical protein
MSFQDSEGRWRCSICKLVYPSATLASSCEKAHDIIYVPMKRTDIDKLVQFIFTGGESPLPEDLVKSLMLFTKVKESKDDNEDLF